MTRKKLISKKIHKQSYYQQHIRKN